MYGIVIESLEVIALTFRWQLGISICLVFQIAEQSWCIQAWSINVNNKATVNQTILDKGDNHWGEGSERKL